MTWDAEIASIPTRNEHLLAALLGRRISRLARFAEEPAAELLATTPYALRGVTAGQLFSLADGPAVLTANGSAVCVGHSGELLSLTVERLDDEHALLADWPVVFEATDGEYADPQFARLLGMQIVSIEGFQWMPDLANKDPRRGPVVFAKALDRPREAILAVGVEDGAWLVFAYGAVDAPNDFALLMNTEPWAHAGYRKIFQLM